MTHGTLRHPERDSAARPRARQPAHHAPVVRLRVPLGLGARARGRALPHLLHPAHFGLLDRTGEFYTHAQRRYDDTAILVAEMCEWGYEQGRGKEALERMNWAHGHYKIANDDFLYVLSTFIFEPIRWIDAFCWRKLCSNERLGLLLFLARDREADGHQGHSADLRSVRGLDRRLREGAISASPTPTSESARPRAICSRRGRRASMAPFVRYGIYALLDDDMLAAFGFPKPLPLTRPLLRGALRMRGRARSLAAAAGTRRISSPTIPIAPMPTATRLRSSDLRGSWPTNGNTDHDPEQTNRPAVYGRLRAIQSRRNLVVPD